MLMNMVMEMFSPGIWALVSTPALYFFCFFFLVPVGEPESPEPGSPEPGSPEPESESESEWIGEGM